MPIIVNYTHYARVNRQARGPRLMGGRTSEEKRKLYKLAAHIAGARPPERRQRKSPACAGLGSFGVLNQNCDRNRHDDDCSDEDRTKLFH